MLTNIYGIEKKKFKTKKLKGMVNYLSGLSTIPQRSI